MRSEADETFVIVETLLQINRVKLLFLHKSAGIEKFNTWFLNLNF